MANKSGSRKTRVFISYSRKNKLFVRKLNKAIDESGIEAWVDWEGIPLSSDWMAEITTALAASDAFIFVITPDSLKSKACMDELELCIKYNKKMIPVLHRDPEKGHKMHPKLASTNWVYMRPKKDDFKTTVPKLIESIQTDLGWVQQHTRLLQRATEWEQKNRNKSYLLQGSDLSDGERWMIESTKEEARAVVPIQAEYINASRKIAVERQRNLTIGIGLAMVISILLGIFAIGQWYKAEENAGLARNSAATAIANEHIAATQQARAEKSEADALEKENEAKAQRSAIQAGTYEGSPGGLFTSTLLALESWIRLPSNNSNAENILRNNLTHMAIPLGYVQQNNKVWDVSTSADGKYFLTASDDNTACLWTLQGQKKYCVKYNGVLYDAVLSVDNKYLVTAGSDGHVNLWNGESGEPIKSFEYKANIWDIDISPNNKWLAIGRADGTMTLIDLAKAREEFSFYMGTSEIYVVAFNQTSEWLAIGLKNGQTTIWRVNTADSKAGPRHTAEVNAIKFSPDGDWLVSISSDNTARVAKTNSGGTKFILPHNDWVEDVAFSPDSSWFVTASDDKLARVFETKTGREKFRMHHDDFVTVVDVSPNGQWIATTGADKTARVWDATSGTLVREIVLDAEGTALTFSVDNNRLLVGDRDGKTSIWDISALGARIGYLEFPEIVRKAEFNDTGKWVVFNSDDQNLWLVPADQLTALHDGIQGKKILTLENLTSQTSVSPNSKWVAVTEIGANRADLFNIETSVRHILLHDSDISGIAFSADSKLLATTREKGTSVYIWDVESGQQVEEIPFDRTAFTIAFNPLDSTLAIGFTDRIVIWDVAGKKEVTSLQQAGDINSLTFSKDGHWLATATSIGSLSIWDMSNGLPVAPTHTFLQDGDIASLDFNANGTLLASGGSNGYAYIWDIASGEERARLPHDNAISSVNFSPINDQLLTASQKVVRVWDVSKLEFITTEKIVETACTKLPKNFSVSAWTFFFHDEEYRLLCPNLPQG
jgi:WD40 repeat protein